MPPRRRRAVQHPCVVCAQFLRPETFEEPDVSCDGCSNDARVGHKRAPVAHIACILPGGTDDDDDEKKGMILDQDGDGVTTWLCQRCRRRTMDPEGPPAPAVAAAPTPAAAETLPLAEPESSLLPPAAPPSAQPAAEDSTYPQDFICPITQAVMVDPCVCADGRSYERAAIEAWLEAHDTSPHSNEPLEHKQLVPNITLRNAIIAFRSRAEVPAPVAAEPAPAPESRSRSQSRSRGRRRRSRSRSRSHGRRRRSRGRRRRSRSRSRSRRRRSRGSRRRRSRSRERSRERAGDMPRGAPFAAPVPWGSPLTNPALQRGRAYSKAPRRHRSRSRG